MSGWTRYHLLPHLGLVLFLCGGLPRWQSRFGIDPSGSLSSRQTIAIVGLLGVLWVCQVPRAVLMNTWRSDYDVPQQNALRLLEEVDAICRQHHIGRETARQALEWRPEFVAPLAATQAAPFPAGLPWAALCLNGEGRQRAWLEIPAGENRENGWNFLRGSDTPQPDLTVEEARRLLCPSGDE